MEYAAKKPYPSPRVEKQNYYYAQLLLNDYSGINGELTAITLYIYQNLTNFPYYQEIANHLVKIAIVEMHHLSLLGKTIKLLGINPTYIYQDFNKRENWTANFVNYDTNIISQLKYNIQKEQITINNYLYHIQMINDKYIKNLLYRLIEDEKIHISCFQKMLNTLQLNCLDLQ